MNPYTIWFAIFALIGYFIVTDASVAYAATLVSKLIRFQYEKTKWWIWMNPKTPWAKYIMWNRSMKLAKDLIKEMEEKKELGQK